MKTITRIGPKHQVTIPREVFERLRLAPGEYLEVKVDGEHISMAPQKFIPRDQNWFFTPEWQSKEEEADKAIAAGQVSNAFSSANKLLAHLKKQRRKKQKA